MIITQPVLKAGVINANGYMYDQDCLHLINTQIHRKIKEMGVYFGEFIHPEKEFSAFVNLKNVSHTVVDSEVKGDLLIAKIKVLDSPRGKELSNILKLNKNAVVFRPRGSGNITVANKVEDYKLFAINAINSETDAFKGLI